MSDPTDAIAHSLEPFRSYLNLLARLHLDPRLRGKVDLSGVVQQSLWEASQVLARRGSEGQPAAPLLRRLLANNLADEVRKCYADKRDAARDQSLEAALQESSARLEAFLAAEDSSPSRRAERTEDLARLAAALEALPEAQRRAVELHYLQGRPLADVARELGRTKAAIAGLLHRGLDALKSTLIPNPRGDP
ncbi:MAG: sigma-70 family RNA polymerase sigma factor [Planctomycetes bacterium]|nr:sigma-70 family RNA polymerase sigma factor [Planctomycetota bacterium]